MSETRNVGAAVGDDELAALAEQINAAHQRYKAHRQSAEEHLTQAVAEAIVTGERLIEAKARLRVEEGSGHWERWVEANCPFSPRHARRYMRIARGKDHFGLASPKSQREALAILNAEKDSEEDTAELETVDAEAGYADDFGDDENENGAEAEETAPAPAPSPTVWSWLARLGAVWEDGEPEWRDAVISAIRSSVTISEATVVKTVEAQLGASADDPLVAQGLIERDEATGRIRVTAKGAKSVRASAPRQELVISPP